MRSRHNPASASLPLLDPSQQGCRNLLGSPRRCRTIPHQVWRPGGPLAWVCYASRQLHSLACLLHRVSTITLLFKLLAVLGIHYHGPCMPTGFASVARTMQTIPCALSPPHSFDCRDSDPIPLCRCGTAGGQGTWLRTLCHTTVLSRRRSIFQLVGLGHHTVSVRRIWPSYHMGCNQGEHLLYTHLQQCLYSVCNTSSMHVWLG